MDYLTISGFTSLNGLICLHSVLDKAGNLLAGNVTGKFRTLFQRYVRGTKNVKWVMWRDHAPFQGQFVVR